MNKNTITEIKKGQLGTGLLIENDGYMSLSSNDNLVIKESIETSLRNGKELPNPFIVSAVFQKCDIENANGRIYPEHILKREVEKYQQLIRERRSYGECYRPTANILTEKGWKELKDIEVGENILTLNPNTKEIEIKPVLNVIKHEHKGNLIHIKGNSIDECVTPEHGFPTFNRKHVFDKFITAEELLNNKSNSHSYIPKNGTWVGKNDEYFIIPSVKDKIIRNKKLKEKYSKDLIIPYDVFAKFMGIYLSEGCCSHNKKYNVFIYQKKEDVCEEIEKMLEELGIKFSISVKKNGIKIYTITDMRLNLYLRQFGNCYTKFVPFELKQQNSNILKLFYDWFVMGDGRIRGDKRRCKAEQLTSDVFSTSKRLALDLSEIILKIGYSPSFHCELRNNERIIEGRKILEENTHPLYFAYKGLSKGIYTDKRFLKTEEIPYEGEVMCVEVENHIWYVMENGKAHWTKNCNHPSDTTIDLSRVCMNIIELHWVGHTLVGKLEIPITEGFRKLGIVSTQADMIAQWLISGLKIGVSSRGIGTVTQQGNHVVVNEDFEILCWDVVSTPSTPNAYIETDEQKLQPYIQETLKTKNQNTLNEDKYSKFDKWLLS